MDFNAFFPENIEETEQEIDFFAEDIDFELQNQEAIYSWIEATIEEEKKTYSTISYIFCSDEYLHKINLEHLDHDDYTDIITFPYSDERVEGDIFISIERVKENAAQFNVSFENELHRVLIHGVLHLIGYLDKTPDAKKIMTEKENYYLAKRNL